MKFHKRYTEQESMQPRLRLCFFEVFIKDFLQQINMTFQEQQMGEQVMTQSSLIEYENSKLKYVRMWIFASLFVLVLTNITLSVSGKVQTSSIWAAVLLNLTVFVILIGLFLSYKRNIKTIYWTILLYQIRLFQAYLNIG